MFIDTSQFPFVKALEDRWLEIRDEFLALPVGALRPWLQRSIYDDGWSLLGLFVDGDFIDRSVALCPKTHEALKEVPGLIMASFSRLKAGAHVKAHEGWSASCYRLHLGLVVPGPSRLRVAGETRAWAEGEVLIFDDTVEHEAWNDATEDRAVLMLDFLRPGYEGEIKDFMPFEIRRLIKEAIQSL